MVDLLVVSAGGHLEQLRTLVARVASEPGLWATYGVPHTASSLSDERVVHTYHPTTKNVPNAVRNYRLARRVFAEHDFERVISTGAAVAVPFMLRARQLDIPCHYIESATRVDGPSLSGRMVARLRGVKLYRQLGDWGEPRWRQGPCVFDGFATAPRGASAEARLPGTSSPASAEAPIARLVVSRGTHGFGFAALVERLAERFRRSAFEGRDVEILWQLGSTPDPGDLPGRVVDQLPHDELQAAVEDADVVVGHAGVGLTLTALQAGTVPVLVPRRKARREHTDDHQVQLARELDRRGLAVAAEVGELTGEHLDRAASLAVAYDEPEPFMLID
jgi:UDP-N-acetylglucosamine--N-acetylmuramyl-(pentapeptide) pyrophosphoryl-undecaprenol N-acetylglucosamine transferase